MMNIGYLAGLRHGAWLRQRFAASSRRAGWLQQRLQAARLRNGLPAAPIPITLVTFSGSRDLPEQLASLLALLANLGTPQRIWIGSDGSHSSTERALLESLDPCIRVVGWDSLAADPVPPPVERHAAAHPLGRKLALLHGLTSSAADSHLASGTQLLYADSDVLLFPAARGWAASQIWPDAPGEYLLDCQPALDSALLPTANAARIPLNSGFLLFSNINPPQWEPALAALAAWPQPPGHYTEQTVVHLALQPPHYLPLPHHQFVVSILDQFRYRDLHLERQPDLVLRHYVNNVRFKFWTQLNQAIGPW
jgi:hypothetical protein